nr:terminase small subunit [Conchiformibius kuhniae]
MPPPACAGTSNKEAAIEAGYSKKTASAAGARLAKQPEVQALMTAMAQNTPTNPAAKAETPAPTEAAPAIPPARARAVFNGETVELDGQTYTLSDPKDLLTLHMLGVIALSKQQQESAKALLPFAHGKIGDQGKKGAEAEAARQVVQNSLFAPMPPPPDKQNSLFSAVTH